MSAQCLFCKIVNAEIPATRVYEDDRVLAFMDINPINDGHLLVMPKSHAATIYEIDPSDLAAVMVAAHKLARAQLAALEMPGLNLLQSNGRPANQLVDHFHVHLIPRWPEDNFSRMHWNPIPGDPADIAATADRISARIAGGLAGSGR